MRESHMIHKIVQLREFSEKNKSPRDNVLHIEKNGESLGMKLFMSRSQIIRHSLCIVFGPYSVTKSETGSGYLDYRVNIWVIKMIYFFNHEEGYSLTGLRP